MKILVVQDYLRSGGTERQSVLMARAFRAAGHELKLLTFRPRGVLSTTLSGVPHESLQLLDTGLDWFAPGLLWRARRFDPDVVLCMGRMANCWAGFLQTSLRRRNRHCAVVGTLRTGKRLPWLYRRSLRLVKHVVANSIDARNELIHEYAVPATRISVIHNALVFPPRVEDGPGRISDRDQAEREKRGAAPGTCVLLWVGMFRREKNHRGMIEIAAKLPAELDWQLWFAGDGPERAGCEARVKELGLQSRVQFLGFQADPTPLYAAADIAVLTSRSESLSNFLIESHAHGLPSVAYAVTGVSECGGKIVQAEDTKAFTHELLALARDLPGRRKEGERLAKFARDHFSPAKQATRYLDLFRGLSQAAAYEE